MLSEQPGLMKLYTAEVAKIDTKIVELKKQIEELEHERNGWLFIVEKTSTLLKSTKPEKIVIEIEQTYSFICSSAGQTTARSLVNDYAAYGIETSQNVINKHLKVLEHNNRIRQTNKPFKRNKTYRVIRS